LKNIDKIFVSISAGFTAPPGERLLTTFCDFSGKVVEILIGHVSPTPGEAHCLLGIAAREFYPQPKIMDEIVQIGQFIFWYEFDFFLHSSSYGRCVNGHKFLLLDKL
jgi:hypothetical protein